MANAFESPNTLAPLDILQAFCARHPEEEVQLEIRRWFILALKANYDGLSTVRTTRLISFYEQLRTVISALYRLEDDTATPPSLALALEELSLYLTPNWTLLVAPPE
ncbi:hypothetical protein [Pontibacter mangrovi]|uniref:Uncharacterized protein n=1 Tax=Pontibacter mangrovi TaxID=2589816 RepID=A0A501W1I1_9BACT|nr:hypothetical protein [Pontibacter mangrovi]TPE42455.1 hypothetical protein FJM65_17770 [Pontibacter mangrovi]